MCTNFAYRTLTYQGFTKDTICYLTSDTDIDLDDNGRKDDVDGTPTSTSLQHAITEWALEKPCADSLVLYITDHGDVGTFRMNDHEILFLDDLNSWLDQVQEEITGKIVIVYDACHSGSFLSFAERERIVITSTLSEEKAKFISQGAISFSSFFWTRIFNGRDIKDAFKLASNAMNVFQYPLLDANSNRQGNETEDFMRVRGICIGNGTDSW